MKKVLFLPFLKMPSGHHQVAHALGAWLRTVDRSLVLEKVDIFSYAYKKLEAFTSRAYLQAIASVPLLYSWLYRKNACDNREKDRFFIYEALFERAMLKLLDEKRPDWIICTHALPSYILNRLKQMDAMDIPVANVYTDFFINTIWGLNAIEIHLVPDVFFKQQLIEKGIDEDRIFVTGIPVHPLIRPRDRMVRSDSGQFNFLVTGGSLGVGGLTSLVRQMPPSDKMRYFVLCGKNQRLYEAIKSENRPNVHPLPYIQSRREMNALYEKMHGMITKPGGVTVSECLYKQIPIFIYHALPGQEEMNLSYLMSEGLVFDVRGNRGEFVKQKLLHCLSEQSEMAAYEERINAYHQRIAGENLPHFLARMFGLASCFSHL